MNSQQHKRITLKDISEQCGYSVNTVSRALRDDPRLPEATISRIKQVADELGYMKNIIASSMRSGHTNLIAVIVDDIQNLIILILSHKFLSNCENMDIIL